MTSSASSSSGDAPTELGLETEDRGGGSSTSPAPLDPGSIVGRYVILSRLGAGGMGVVYAAHDPELDRKVALKLLRPGLGGSAVGRARLLREAQALARLSHPNVVAVHDVGTHHEAVWIAMEFVAGQTLGAWLRGGAESRPRRSPAEVLAVLVQAGRGVVAAHAAGLLHRDLKPDNIMIGPDGRVWVMDFGLARSQLHGSEDAALEGAIPSESSTGSFTADLTEMGALVGTPAYMAPEQFLGQPVDARTDEWSLCVTLWEALYGERPFQGENVHELCLAITLGERRPAPRGTRVPGWLRRACERGLSVDPRARFPSVEALLQTLERGRARARRTVGAAALVVAGAAAAASWAWQQHDERQRIAACEAEGASIEAVWGPTARTAVREAFTATEASLGPDTAERVTPWLDRYASAWSDARVETCEAARVHGTWSEATLERAQWCLDERRSQLAARVELLASGGMPALVTAVNAAASLPSVGSCRDQAKLERLPLPPAEERERLETVRHDLSAADALEQAGRYAEGLELATGALDGAEALGWPPLVAAARLELGGLLVGAGRPVDAEPMLEEAYFVARAAGALELAADASTLLIAIVGRRLARPAEGLRWSRLAELALLDLGHADPLREAAWRMGLADVHTSAGEHARAEAALERARVLLVEALGPEHPKLDGVFTNFAILHSAKGELLAAKAMFERVVEMRTQTLGPTHPDVAAALNNLANIERDLGEYAEAKALHQRALAIKEQRLGPDHLDVATSLMNLGLVLHSLGTDDEARAMFERALTIVEAKQGRDHPTAAQLLIDLALLDQTADDMAAARARLERALAIVERAHGPSHPLVAQVLTNLGNVLNATHEQAAARTMLVRAAKILETALGPTHPHLGHPLIGLAMVELDEGRPADARVSSERALRLWTAAGVPPEEQADARVLLARALLATRGDRALARGLVDQALTAYRAAKPAKAEELAKLEAWVKGGLPPSGP